MFIMNQAPVAEGSLTEFTITGSTYAPEGDV